MANVTAHARVEMQATFVFSEAEVRALRAITMYGDRAFLKMFYEHLGKTELYPHEAGVRSLFKSVNEQVGDLLSRTDDARKVFDGARVAVASATLDRWKEAAERPDPTPPLLAALRYALPLVEKYAHTQGDNAEYHAELTAPIRAALGDGPPTTIAPTGNVDGEHDG